MEQAKKKRGENWSSEEKVILRQLIVKSAKILEDKSTKTNINMLKKREWKNVSNKLNQITGKNRSDAEIKLAWKRMKMAAKANLSLHRREQSEKGETNKPPSPSPEDQEDWSIQNSNIDFKKKQLHMLEVEHNYQVEISKLKIKKLQLQIALLENPIITNSGAEE